MLIYFRVSNFLSFKEEVIFSLEAASIKDYSESNVFEDPSASLKLLKGAVLYGNNSAGKSNLIKALHFVKNFVLDSAKDLQAIDDVELFKLSTTTSKKPSFFEVNFIVNQVQYKLGFELDKARIHREYLYEVRKTKEVVLYNRIQDRFEIAEDFSNDARGLEDKTRSNALFLSVLAQFNSPVAISITGWVRNILFLYDIDFRRHFNRTIKMMADKRKKQAILKILSAGNLGFKDISIRKRISEEHWDTLPDDIRRVIKSSLTEEFQVNTIHSKFDHLGNIVDDVQLDMVKEESLGTQKYFALTGYMLEALQNGKLLVIDELDAKLHTLLASLIIRIFNSTTDNPYNAQLVFSTQNTNILGEDLLRRDQIYFIAKNKFGATELTTLHALGARNDASFEKEYLRGEYNAVPFKGRPKQLNIFPADEGLPEDSQEV